MSIPRATFLLTTLALLAGAGIVLFTLHYQRLVASLDNRPMVISDDMGTGGVGNASDALPSATSSLR